MLRIIHWLGCSLYWLGLCLGLAVTLPGLLALQLPQYDLPNHFRPFTLLGCFGLMALGMATWRGRWPKAAIGLTALNLTLALPAFVMTASRGDNAGGENIKVLSINLWVSREYAAIQALIERIDPDIIMLQEVRARHVSALLPRLRARYPHLAKGAYNEVALLSRRPLANVESLEETADRPAVATALWTSAAGKTYRVASVHLAWPYQSDIQARHVSWLVEASQRWPEPQIIAGDFNLTPWSAMMNRLTWSSGLRRHGLLGFSWPSQDAGRLPPVVLIDNILSSSSIGGSHFRVEEDVGSDHRPVSVELSLR